MIRVNLLILNYNGRDLLEACLPSIIAAAEASRYAPRVSIVDNDSTDDSLQWLAEHHPNVKIHRCENRGLCSFNDVAAELIDDVLFLLNSDIKLDRRAVDPLVDALLADGRCFMTAPLCRLFDETTYEGCKTAVRTRWGLVQGTVFYDGHEKTVKRPDWTAAAGAVMAVRRNAFVELGGFDPLYLPGRIEDLDLGYRAFAAGYHAKYVPQALAFHRGMASFGEAFGRSGCDELAVRNTLLFQWKNLRHPWLRLRLGLGLAARFAWEALRAPWTPRETRWALSRAFREARRRRGLIRRSDHPVSRERAFFERFSPKRLRGAP